MRPAALVLAVACAAWSAEPDRRLEAAAATAREQAAERLAASRSRIASEQAGLLTALAAAAGEADRARDRLAAARAGTAAAEAAVARLDADRLRERMLAEQLADRAIAAARPPGTGHAARTPSERIDLAIAALVRRADALPGRLALRRGDEPVVARDGVVIAVPVLRLGEARAVALGGTDATRGLLTRTADGAWMVTGPSIPHSDGAIPFDAAGSAEPAAAGRSLGEWLAAGRAFIWPIIAVLAIGLWLSGRRLAALAGQRYAPDRLGEVAGRMSAGGPEAAAELVAAGATPLDRVLRAAIAADGRPQEVREAAIERVVLAESAALTGGLPAIAVLAGIAPLLGLLGTVTGMIDMFSVIAAQGSGSARSLSGGISEALVCTQAGMLAAIPLLVAHAWIGRMADRRIAQLEEASCMILGMSAQRRA